MSRSKPLSPSQEAERREDRMLWCVFGVVAGLMGLGLWKVVEMGWWLGERLAGR